MSLRLNVLTLLELRSEYILKVKDYKRFRLSSKILSALHYFLRNGFSFGIYPSRILLSLPSSLDFILVFDLSSFPSSSDFSWSLDDLISDFERFLGRRPLFRSFSVSNSLFLHLSFRSPELLSPSDLFFVSCTFSF